MIFVTWDEWGGYDHVAPPLRARGMLSDDLGDMFDFYNRRNRTSSCKRIWIRKIYCANFPTTARRRLTH